MINNYPLKYKKFDKVIFISGNSQLGQRIKLDPSDFNQMQDIWREKLDSFIGAIRGLEGGVLDGCNVVVQAAQLTNAPSGYEAVVFPGHVYVNSTIAWLAQPHAIEIPVPTWVGFKQWYFIIKPVLQTFVPTAIGEPGFSLMAGRPTSNRLEVSFELSIVDALPSNGDEWYVLLAEFTIDSPVINGVNDIIIDLSRRNNLMTMRAIQDIATQTRLNLNSHLQSFFVKQRLIGIVDGANKTFCTQFPVASDSESLLKVFRNGGDIEIATIDYQVQTYEENNIHRTEIVFTVAPLAGDILCASYYPEQHYQHLTTFTFEKHIQADNGDHDNRYYTKAETNSWQEAHNVNKEAHSTHVLWDDFNSWKHSHTSLQTMDHDNVYARAIHRHSLDNVLTLRDQLTKIEEEIGYGKNHHYIVTQKIIQNVDGTNKVFPLNSTLLDSGVGYVKQVRADITQDAVKNPVILKVIDAAQEFDAPTASAFSDPKRLSQRYLNSNPVVISQSDQEIWAIWATKHTDMLSSIWFSSYKPGDGFFSPATSTELPCHPSSKISATVVTSANALVNQRIVLVWEFNDKLYYSYIDRGQTEWRQATEILGSDGCYEPALGWINDNSENGKIYLLYKKTDIASGLPAVYRRRFEINFSEYDIETKISEQNMAQISPAIFQEMTPLKRVWYLWLTYEQNAIEPDNSWNLHCEIVDRFGDSVYQAESVVGNIVGLNASSGISVSPSKDGLWIQYAKPEGGLFNVYYQQFSYDGAELEPPVFLVQGNKNSVTCASDGSIWCVHEHIDSIYYRARQQNVGEVKWNKGLRRLEFEVAPVVYPIYVDIAVPIKSLNDRISSLESKEADTEEELASKIRESISALGLENPLDRINSLFEKIKIESATEIDTRRLALGYDTVVYNKFFDYNAAYNVPVGLMTEVLKGGSPTLFATSGMYHDDTGIIWNKTGQVIKVYSVIYTPPNFFTNGKVRLEAHGDLNCVDFRITSTMESSPFSPRIQWIPSGGKIVLGHDLNLSGDPVFIANNRFAIEITLRPNGYLHDWALFLKG